MFRTSLILALTAVSGLALAAEPSVNSDCEVRWLTRPSDAAINSVVPKRAREIGQGGEVIMLCVVQTDGRMGECKVTKERPPNRGFGEAALKLKGGFSMTPCASPEGKTTVTIPIIFR